MKKFIGILTLVFSCGWSQAYAIWPDFTPLIPVAPQVCAMCTPTAISEVTGTISQVKGMEDKFTQVNIVSKVKQAATKYATQLGVSMFNNFRRNAGSREKVVSASRTIEECTVADIHNEESVKEAYIKLFLQYPSREKKVNAIYRAKGEQFQMDTTLEMYITAREMEKELKEMLTELDNIERCLVAGEDCSKEGMEEYNCQKSGDEEGEDKLCLWRNALNAVRIYDKIMRYNEFLVAMNAQFNSVRSINGKAKIREFEGSDEEDIGLKGKKKKKKKEKKKEKKKASLEINNEPVYVASGTISSRMAFAEVNTFERLKGSSIESPLKGKEDDFESLTKISNAQAKIDIAKEAHNIKQNMSKYRKNFETYNKFKNYHDKTLEYLKKSEECAKNYISTYYGSGEKSWMGKACSMHDDVLLCHYSPEKSAEDTTESAGMYDMLCPNDLAHKCYVAEVNNYDVRSGLSGYLLALYTEAKATETTSNNDIYMTTQDEDSDYEIQSLSAVKKQGQDAYNSGEKPQNLKKVSMEEDLQAESRKNGLLNWTLGAEVSKAMVKDLNKATSQFGSRKRRFPAWNDQRYFYDQYIDGKYANIKDYIQNEPFVTILLNLETKIKQFLPPVTAIGASALRTQKRSELNELEKEIEQGNGVSAEMDSLLAAEKQALAGITSSHNNKMRAYASQKTSLYQRLENVNTQLSNARDTYNSNNEKISTSDNRTPTAEEGVEYGKAFNRGGTISPQSASLNQHLSENESNKLAGLSGRESASLSMQGLDKQAASLQKELDELKQTIENERIAYVKAYSDMEYSYKKKVNELLEKQEKAALLSKVATIANVVPSLAAANEIIERIRAYALAQVDEAYQKITALKNGDVLYQAENIGKITAIHEEMIDKITHISLEDLGGIPLLSKLLVFTNETEEQKNANISLVNNILGIFGDVCEGINCTTPDTEYFVGIMGKRRDFRAPKEPVRFSSAPLREIFHFDLTDYNAIAKYYKNKDDISSNINVTIIGDSILNSGIDIPEIWKYILKHRAYVEKDIDYAALLNAGNPGKSVMRSGVYPCRLKGKIIDVIPATESTQATYTTGGADTSAFDKVQECQGLVLSSGGYASITDTEAGATIPVGNGEDDGGDAAKSSELGQLLDYVPEMEINMSHGIIPNITTRYKLTFRQALQKAVHMINTTQNVGEGNATVDAAFYMYNRVFFERNQFGDYLDNVELEQIVADTLIQMQTQIEGFRDMIKTIFEDIGYTLSDDFDLTDIDDYNLAVKILEDRKNNNIRLAKEIQSGVISTTDTVTDKNNNLTHQIKVLEMDGDEVIAVNGNEDLSELAEKIKNGRANNAVEDTYQTAGSEEFDRKINQLRAPYCAMYPKPVNGTSGASSPQSSDVGSQKLEFNNGIGTAVKNALVSTVDNIKDEIKASQFQQISPNAKNVKQGKSRITKGNTVSSVKRSDTKANSLLQKQLSEGVSKLSPMDNAGRVKETAAPVSTGTFSGKLETSPQQLLKANIPGLSSEIGEMAGMIKENAASVSTGVFSEKLDAFQQMLNANIPDLSSKMGETAGMMKETAAPESVDAVQKTATPASAGIFSGKLETSPQQLNLNNSNVLSKVEKSAEAIKKTVASVPTGEIKKNVAPTSTGAAQKTVAPASAGTFSGRVGAAPQQLNLNNSNVLSKVEKK